MNETIRSRTARSSLTLLRATLQTFRSLDVTDPAQAPRVIKTAELLSMTAKNLGKFLTDHAHGEAAKNAEPPEPKFDVFRVEAALAGIVNGGCCPRCGGYIPNHEDNGGNVPDEVAEGALRAVRNAERQA